MTQFRFSTLNDTARWGHALGQSLISGDVIALIGEVGAGKTTLTQSIAKGIGIQEAVTSPTFTLIQNYSGPIPMFHFDPYRLENPLEMEDLGLYDYLEADGIVVIEWADQIGELMPPDYLEIRLLISEQLAPTSGNSSLENANNEPRLANVIPHGLRSKTVIDTLIGNAELASLIVQESN